MADKLSVADGDCLHCVINDVIDAWVKRHVRHGGEVVLDIGDTLIDLARVSVDLCDGIPDHSKRRLAFRFAHGALDGALNAKRTGTDIFVDLPSEH